ncbi:DUF444 family protein [Candidatus Woesearchaeota archaeon]|nr:DUF444 family protein [Candidatus Woesearchaeota archaeon]
MKINRGKLALADHDELLEHAKEDFDHVVEETKMIKDGKVTIKVKTLSLPTPTYADEGGGMLVQGPGGKPMDVGQDPGQGAGDHHSDYELQKMDFDEFVREYQKYLLKDLELPLIKTAMNGDNPKEEPVLDDFSREGMRCDLDLDMTLEQAFDRAFISQQEVSIDPRIDGWYWSERPTKEKQHKCLEIYVLDVSGSVSGSTLALVRKMIFCLYYYLDKKYSSNERKYIVFQDTSEEKTRDEFFSIESRGGTHISSGLEHALEIAKGYENYDKYLFFFSDFDNSSGDDDKAAKALTALAASFTYMCMSQICADSSKDTSFSKIARNYAQQYHNIAYAQLDNESKIRRAIIDLLTKHENP